MAVFHPQPRAASSERPVYSRHRRLRKSKEPSGKLDHTSSGLRRSWFSVSLPISSFHGNAGTVPALINTTLCAKPPKAGKSPPQKWRREILRRRLRMTFLSVRIGKIRSRKRAAVANHKLGQGELPSTILHLQAALRRRPKKNSQLPSSSASCMASSIASWASKKSPRLNNSTPVRKACRPASCRSTI